MSPEYVEAVVAELEHESERRVKKLKRQMGDMRQEFLNHFQVELLKIPRKIREMKVEHFSSEYGGSMEEALKKAAQWEVEKVAPTPRPRGAVAATPRGGHSALARVAATPARLRAPRRAGRSCPSTARRLAAAHVDGQARGDDQGQGPQVQAARRRRGPAGAARRAALGPAASRSTTAFARRSRDPTMTADAWRTSPRSRAVSGPRGTPRPPRGPLAHQD